MSVFWCSVVYFVIKIWISFSKIFRNKEQVNVVLFSITDYAIQCFMFNTKYDNIIAHSRYCLSSHSRNRETRGGVCVCVSSHAPLPRLSARSAQKNVKPNPSSRSQSLVILKPNTQLPRQDHGSNAERAV